MVDTVGVDVPDLDQDPLRQLDDWLEAARAAGDPMPHAMCLATASAGGTPSARYVLMRGRDEGVVFFTDYGSDKARDLGENPTASAVFHWHVPVHRQVRVSGAVVKTTAEESDQYWLTRPEASRRSAVASKQSSVLPSRQVLEDAVSLLGDVAPPRPDRWGGYRIIPTAVEFWQEGPYRLHDRLRYLRERDGWRVDRLAP
ncbi:MAG: pyridoxamine 5'-phosphate oxidase [Actinomycetota bacterium]|jgi:pyridoxamine 5'-phosphate oxidase|nr:pyridoxamine 5'-phosphate oxidase [Actinomycetota bacterium]